MAVDNILHMISNYQKCSEYKMVVLPGRQSGGCSRGDSPHQQYPCGIRGQFMKYIIDGGNTVVSWGCREIFCGKGQLTLSCFVFV